MENSDLVGGAKLPRKQVLTELRLATTSEWQALLCLHRPRCALLVQLYLTVTDFVVDGRTLGPAGSRACDSQRRMVQKAVGYLTIFCQPLSDRQEFLHTPPLRRRS